MAKPKNDTPTPPNDPEATERALFDGAQPTPPPEPPPALPGIAEHVTRRIDGHDKPPTCGRMVHYTDCADDTIEVLPAIVINADSAGGEPTITLVAFCPHRGAIYRRGVPQADKPGQRTAIGRWAWPPREA